MGLSNVNIILGNGNIGTVSLSDDGIAGLIVTGTAVASKLTLNQVYVLGSIKDLEKLGIEESNNPLAYKDVMAFYMQAGNGAELHLMVVGTETPITDICAFNESSPMNKLVKSAGGRIRVVGVNVPPAKTPEAEDPYIEAAVTTAVSTAQQVADGFAEQMWPIRVLLPANGWNKQSSEADKFQPRNASYNRVALVLCSDKKITVADTTMPSAAIGQVLGRVAAIPVHRSIARVRDGAISVEGYLMDGEKPEENVSLWNLLDENGFIFYRTFIGKNGYYLNDDSMCAGDKDDYSFLNLGRVIDKAIIIAYKTYIEDLMDNIIIDDKGQISAPICKSFEASINRAVNSNMGDEISSFSSFVNPAQDVLTTGRIDISCKIVPQAILREINVNLSFSNPTAN